MVGQTQPDDHWALPFLSIVTFQELVKEFAYLSFIEAETTRIQGP